MPRVKMSVSLPKSLKERMSRCPKGLFNWSSLARIAFERAMADAEKASSQQEKMKMESVIERLRASKEESSSEQRRDGHDSGQCWATRYAKAGELERISGLYHADGRSWEECFDGEFGAYGPGEIFHRVISNADADDNPDVWSRTDGENFWDETLGGEEKHKADDAEFVIGFAIGALAIWDEVSDQL